MMKSDLYTLFLAEQHQEVLEAGQSSDMSPADMVAVIGSLAAVGQCDIADVLLKQLPDDDYERRAESLCYLAIARTRGRDLSEARRLLGELLRLSKISVSLSVRLFLHVALGHYRFFGGRLRCALVHGSRALEVAVELDDAYSRLLAYDLVASVHAKRGSYKPGLFYFGRAIGCAARLGRSRQGKGLGVQLTIHMSLSGPVGISVPEHLTTALSVLPNDRPLWRGSLLLEIGRQWITQGALEKARHALDEAFDIIQPSGDIRYEATLALRYAELALGGGYAREAFLHVARAEGLLSAGVDDLLIADVVRLRIVALNRLGRTDEAVRDRVTLEAMIQRLDLAKRADDATWAGETLPMPAVNLNIRQQQIVSYLARHAFINVSEYKSMFRVSDITACRDLSNLTKVGILDRIGRARATRYSLKAVLH